MLEIYALRYFRGDENILILVERPQDGNNAVSIGWRYDARWKLLLKYPREDHFLERSRPTSSFAHFGYLWREAYKAELRAEKKSLISWLRSLPAPPYIPIPSRASTYANCQIPSVYDAFHEPGTKTVILSSPDSSFVNVARSRKSLSHIFTRSWKVWQSSWRIYEHVSF